MSQPSSVTPSLLESVEETLDPTMQPQPEAHAASADGFSEGFSMESYASRLMDELFVDVERALNEGASLPVRQPVAGAIAMFPQFYAAAEAAPLATAEPPELAAPEPLPLEPAENSELSAPLEELVSVSLAESSPRPGTVKTVDRLLLLLICGSVAAAGALWWVMQGRWQRTLTASAPAAQEVQVAPANQEFLDYVQRSLNIIDRKAEISNQTTAIAQGINSGNLPSVSVAGTPSQPGTTSLERVYVPVYRPPSNLNLPGRSSVAMQPTLPTVPVAPAVPAAPAAAPQTTAQVPNIAPVSNHTLIGILELGDRSAALFEINGSSQRVQLGEPVGSSGWTLVSVNQDEAVIRRNGEVRSVYIGQRF